MVFKTNKTIDWEDNIYRARILSNALFPEYLTNTSIQTPWLKRWGNELWAWGTMLNSIMCNKTVRGCRDGTECRDLHVEMAALAEE